MRIVKVQVSLSLPVEVLIYDEDKEWWYKGPLPKDVRKVMRGQVKLFFYATLRRGAICLHEEAPWQEW